MGGHVLTTAAQSPLRPYCGVYGSCMCDGRGQRGPAPLSLSPGSLHTHKGV